MPLGCTPDSDLQPTGPSNAEQRRAANFEAFIDSGNFAIVADLTGGRIVGLVDGRGPFRTLSVSTDDGVVEAAIDRYPSETKPNSTRYPALAEARILLEDTDGMQDFVTWCVQDQRVWKLTDGTGYARMEDGALIAVRSRVSVRMP